MTRPDHFTCEDTEIALGAFVASVQESKRTQLAPVYQLRKTLSNVMN